MCPAKNKMVEGYLRLKRVSDRWLWPWLYVTHVAAVESQPVGRAICKWRWNKL